METLILLGIVSLVVAVWTVNVVGRALDDSTGHDSLPLWDALKGALAHGTVGAVLSLVTLLGPMIAYVAWC